MRLFVSIDLPETLTSSVAPLHETLSGIPGLRLTDTSQVHITLKFLGETQPDALEPLEDAIATAVKTAGVEPFEVTFGGVGAFPSNDYIRVIWLGVEKGSEPIHRLHEAIETATVDLGYDPESHDFTPHATLARMQHAAGKSEVQAFLDQPHEAIGSMRVEEVRLKESDRTADGPRYSTVMSFPLEDRA